MPSRSRAALGALLLLLAGNRLDVAGAQQLSFTSPQAVHLDVTSAWPYDTPPNLVVGPNGTVVALWNAQHLGFVFAEVLVARSADGGRSWGPRHRLTTTGADEGFQNRGFALATDGAGQWVAAWTSDDDLGGTIGADDDVLVARSSDDGVTWTAPAPLMPSAASDSGDAAFVALAADETGTFLATWASAGELAGLGDDADVVVSRSTDGGASWSAPVALAADAATDADEDMFTQLTTDGAGAWIAAWVRDPASGDSNLFVARSADAGASWSVPLQLNPTHVAAAPALVAAANGTTLVGWTSTALGAFTPDDVLVARSTDAGASWSAPVPLDVAGGPDDESWFAPTLASDGTGRWIASWRAQSDPFFFVVSLDDGASWTPMTASARDFGPGVRVGTAPGAYLLSTVVDSPYFDQFAVPGPLVPEPGRHVAVAEGALCGDGLLGPGESCEDGNDVDGDGCSAACRMEPCFACTGLPSICVAGARAACKQTAPGRASLQITDKPDGMRDALTWSWLVGEATALDDLGDPYWSHDYALCLYHAPAAPAVARLDVPAGDFCFPDGPFGTIPCWKRSGLPTKSVSYRDRFMTPDGVERLDLKLGATGKAKLTLKGKGENLPDGLLPAMLPLTVQLQSASGTCWESTHSTATKNDATTLRSKGD